MAEKIDLKKFAKGFIQPVNWFKALLFGTIFLIIVLGAYWLFGKPTQNIIAKKGSNVQVTQINKTTKFITPFIEGGRENRSGHSGWFSRFGVRLELPW